MDDFDCDDFEKTLKVIVVGNGNVGKTSMTTRYAKGRYTGNYKKTIGVDFMEKSVELRDLGETVNLMIWDTAGQEEFDTLTSRYYKGAGAVIYVFSTVDRDSFDDLPKWKRKVEDECGQICQVLVQNKIDLIDDAAMSRSEVEDMVDFMNIRLFRSCVQDNVNVKEVFEHLCRRFLKQGGSGGDGRGGDDSHHAVADITMLSERTGLKKSGSSLQRQQSSSSDLFHSSSDHDLRKPNGVTREKAVREADNREEYDHDRTRSPSPQHPYESRVPTGNPFPPSVPALIANDRSRAQEEEEGDSDDDDEGRGRDRRYWDVDYNEEEDRRRSSKGSRQRDGRNDGGRRDRERKLESHDDDRRPAAKVSKSDVSKQTSREPSKRRAPEEDATDDDPRQDGLRFTATRQVSNRTTSARVEEEQNDLDNDEKDEASDERFSSDIAADTSTGLPPRKLQPSKRRTNGKKTRQSVSECVLS